MDRYEEFEPDLPEFARGTLAPQRARELLAAAGHDARLRRAIEQEQSLERWLEWYEVPEPSDGLTARFWQRFHGEKASDGGRALWLLKLAGPLAAAVLISAGLILFFGRDDGPGGSDDELVVRDSGADEGNEDDFINQFVDAGLEETPDQRESDDVAESIALDELRLLKQLADPSFAELDLVPHPDDVPLIEDHELLKELAAEEVK